MTNTQPPARIHDRLFERLERGWESPAARRALGWALVASFIGSIGLIEATRLGWIDAFLGKPLPTNHLFAISWVFTLLLIIEVVDLIFSLARSVANALGKQLEIFSLILVRKTFDELTKLPEPIDLHGELMVLLEMGALAVAALTVFLGLVVYYRLQRHRPISEDEADVARFVSFKRLVCLGLLAAFLITGAAFGVRSFFTDPEGQALSIDFFVVFYTVLVFSDVLLVLGSLTATREYRIVFRNFIFAVVTVFIRLAMVADPFPKAAMAVATAALAVASAWAYGLSRSEGGPEDAGGRS